MTSQILIADRDPVIRNHCRRCLAAHGYDAYVAADALQCVEQLQSWSPDLLVLDPEILWGGGEGVLDWLRQMQPMRPVKIILTDGHCQSALPSELQKLVADRLERPTGLTELTGFVHQLECHLARLGEFSETTSPSESILRV